MRLMKNGLASVVVMAVGVGAIGFSSEPLQAQHVHAHVEKAKNFTEAVSRINEAMARLDAAVKSANMDAIATEADTVAQLARQTRELVMAADSGVARDRVRNVNQTGRNLAGIADQLHTAADKGNINNCRTLHEEVKASHELFIAASPVNGTSQPAAVSSYTVEVTSTSRIEAGKEVSLAFAIRDQADTPVNQFDRSHGHLLHAFVVSEDLSWFLHDHPEQMADGGFVLRASLPHGGTYSVFSDFTPAGKSPVVATSTLNVEGTPKQAEKLVPDINAPKTVDGYTVAMETQGALRAGSVNRLKFTVTRDGNKVEDFQPYMEALGHLAIISADRKHFVHAHPAESEGHDHSHDHAHDDHDHDHDHAHDHDHGDDLTFAATFPAPGMYRSWLQFQHEGKVVTASFTFEVAAATGGKDDHGHDHDHGHNHKH